MKYLHQAVMIAAITFAAEIIKYLIPLPVPASIYGLILLFLLLQTGLVKLSQVEDIGNLLLVPASVSVLTVLDKIQEILLPVLIMGFLGTMAVMFITGRVAQWIVRRDGKEAPHA